MRLAVTSMIVFIGFTAPTAVLAAEAATTPVANSHPPEPENPSAPQACFFSKPQASCFLFPLTEVRVAIVVSDLGAGEHPTVLYSWELGGMMNVAPSDAVGGSIYAQSDDDVGGLQWGLKLRYRRWLNPSFALDVAPGLLLSGNRIDVPYFTGTVGVTYRDWIGLDVQLETRNAYNASGPYTQLAVFAGLRLGGLPGSIAGGLTLGGLGLIYGSLGD